MALVHSTVLFCRTSFCLSYTPTLLTSSPPQSLPHALHSTSYPSLTPSLTHTSHHEPPLSLTLLATYPLTHSHSSPRTSSLTPIPHHANHHARSSSFTSSLTPSHSCHDIISCISLVFPHFLPLVRVFSHPHFLPLSFLPSLRVAPRWQFALGGIMDHKGT